MPETKPLPFLITIDTEGDNLWARPRDVSTQNAAFLERFQRLCERYGLRPTWLTSHEMIGSPIFRHFANDAIQRDVAEIGMHLHAWTCPPFEPLTADDARAAPYLIEYPRRVMREKIHTLTATLEETFGIKMTSHRSGRWAFDEVYATMLLDEGYGVDCSVTPMVDWRSSLGDTAGSGGSDYTCFPREAYWLDLDNISQPGASQLLEVPVTIETFRSVLTDLMAHFMRRLPDPLTHPRSIFQRVANRLSPDAIWLRPNGRNGKRLCELVDRVYDERREYAEFMLHSSELMPGGSPSFPDHASIEMLYHDLEYLFEWISGRFHGATLSEFRNEKALLRSSIR